MKRILIRVSVVSGVIVVGLIAIASAQRYSRNKAATPTTAAAKAEQSPKDAGKDAATSPGTTALLAAAERAADTAAKQGEFDDPFKTTGAAAAPPPANDRYADFYVAANAAQEAASAVADQANAFVKEAAEEMAPVEPAVEAGTPMDNSTAFRDASTPAAAAESTDDQATNRRHEPASPPTDDRHSEWHGETGTLPTDEATDAVPNDQELAAEPTTAAGTQEFDAAEQATSELSQREPAALADEASEPINTAGATENLAPAAPQRWRNGRSTAAAPVEQDSIPQSDEGVATSRNINEPDNAARPKAERLQSAAMGEGVPGDPKLESEQGAALVIHKTGPPEVQLGLETTYEIRVQNVGDAPAPEVEIHHVAPPGAELVATQPQIAPGRNGELIWALGTLAPGEDVTVQMRVTPRAEGEIGSVARVFFSADAAVRTLVTRPQLELTVEAPKSVLAGERAQIFVRVTNTGTGVATGVVLEEIVPAGFEHPAGASLEYRVGTLKPRDSKELPLTLTAVKPMESMNIVSARADGDILVEQRTALAVVAPALQVEMQGPRRRFLDRDATYTVAVSNPGTAPAQEIELVTFLAPGMEFVSADSAGQYDPQTRAVYWLLDELPPNEMGNVTVTARPTKPGEHILRVEGRAKRGLEDIKEQPILVEGLAAVEFQVIDLSDPVEIGGEAAYEIVVKNGGTKAAADVEIVAMLPVEMQLVAAEGPTRHKLAGQKVVFEPIASLAPGESVTFQLTAKTLEAGDARLQVKLLTAEMQSPVTKEENTKIFGDE